MSDRRVICSSVVILCVRLSAFVFVSALYLFVCVCVCLLWARRYVSTAARPL